MGFIIVSPHKSKDYGDGFRPGPLGPMKVVKRRAYKPVTVVDPDAVSMVPIPGWKAPHAPGSLPPLFACADCDYGHAAGLVRRGPDDAAVDMRSGPGWILPYASAVAMGLIAPDVAA